MNNKVVQPKTLQGKIKSLAPILNSVLPKIITADRFIGCALLQLSKNKDLQKCSSASILGALYTTAQLGLEPVGGQSYLVPFGKECQLVIGYQGLVQLYHRNPEAGKITWGVVFEGDILEFEYGTNQYLKHRPAKKANTKNPLSYWVLARLRNGEENFLVWDRDRCIEHGKKWSKSFNSKYSPWQTAPDIMCLKTVLKQLAKTLPVSFDFQKSIAADESIRHYLPGVTDFEDMPNELEEKENGNVIDLSELNPTKKQEPQKDDLNRLPTPDELALLQMQAAKKWGENITTELRNILPGVDEIFQIGTMEDYLLVQGALK